MRNSGLWQPTKVGLRANGRLAIPGAQKGVSAGSLLTATLVARWYAQMLPKYAHGMLLDVGCGKMPYYPLYAPHVERVFGTDWPQSLHGDAFLDFVCDLNIGLPLADRTIDTVLAADVMEHLYKPHVFLAELFRVLRPGGAVLVNTPFMYPVHEPPNEFYRYTTFAMRRFAEDAGFHVESTQSFGGKFPVLADLTGKILQGSLRSVARAIQRTALALCEPLPESEKFSLIVACVFRKP
ncbi:MAG TPA: methyltransferase domain-containing protein [Rhizomicrobium sp.]|nr:methyltransferase domain-containing protein [Rhizomicrobium sp.]